MLPEEGYEVVISGVGGKFPETNNIEELQTKLFDKENLVTIDSRRWPPGFGNTPKAFGKCLGEYKYDAAFFGVHRKLCTSAEPMMKLTMERCYEAMIDAGVNPFTLRGQNIAVFVGTINSESEILQLTHSDLISTGFGILGHSQTLIANRVSYFFNFVGPSFAVNSGIGGTMVFEHAASLIRQGHITAALVTSAYLMWFPSLSKEYQDLNFLTFDEFGRPFDDAANGSVRSEGIVTYFLQRKEDANRVYATVVKAATDGSCGRDTGFIDCAGMDQFLYDFYNKSNLDPSSVAYVEPEGLAVKKFDKTELNSINKVFCQNRKTPLLIGTIKGNVGWSHVASSYLSVAKAIISMEQGKIPATLHYKKPNPDIPGLVNGDLKVVTEETNLPGDLIAVNNISVSGNFGHILLKRNSKAKVMKASDPLPRLVLFSARHEEGANKITDKLHSMPLDLEFISMVNGVHRTSIPNHLYRSYAILNSKKVQNKVEFFDSDKQRPVWFIFSGMGSQWTGMGKDLLQLPIFENAINRCDKVLKPKGIDIRNILTSEDPAVLDNILHCFVGIAAVQVGLVDILKAVGLHPNGIIGHSAGELGCAYADDCFTAEEMVLCAWARGYVSTNNPLIRGLMAAVGMSHKDIKGQLPSSVDVACHNAFDSSTISGPYDDVMEVVKNLKAKGVFAKAVKTDEKSFHSRYIKPIAKQLNELLSDVIKTSKPRSSKWISSSVRENNWDEKEARLASPAYYTNNLLNPVLFEEACAFIPQDAIVVEIAPHGLMQAILRRSLSTNCINISLTSRNVESNLDHLLNALGTLHLKKVDLDINALYPKIEYPVSRGTPSLTPLITWDHTDTWFTEFRNIISMMTAEKSEMTLEFDDRSEELWSQNEIAGEIVVPLSQIIDYTFKLKGKTMNADMKNQAVQVENVIVNEKIVVKPTKQELFVSLLRGTGKFEAFVVSKEVSCPQVTGVLSTVKRPTIVVEKLASNGHFGLRVSQSELYSVLTQYHHHLGPSFQLVKVLHVKDRDFKAIVSWSGDLVPFLEVLFKLIIFVHLSNKQNIVNVNSFRRLLIDTPYFYSLPEGAEVEVWYNSTTNWLYCEGLRLEGVTVSSKPTNETITPALLWKSVKFVPYGENIQSFEEFVCVSAQLVAEEGLNSWTNKIASFNCLEIRDEKNKPFIISKPLQDTLKSLTNISTNLLTRDIQKAKQELSHAGEKTYLIMAEYPTLQYLANSELEQKRLFYLTVIPHNTNFDNTKVQTILFHQMNDGCLVLFKKSSDPSKLRVFELDWMVGLRQFMDHNAGQPVVVVSRQWEQRQALKTLALETYAPQLKCVFLDKRAPQFCLNSPLFHQQMSLGLTVNVLKGSTWGSYRAINLPSLPSDCSSGNRLVSSSKALDISYLSLNTRTFTLEHPVPADQVGLKYLDFCAVRKNGDKVMGIAKFDSKNQRVIPDPLLTWSIPPRWSMEDAVTVPFTFSLAYYCLILRAKLVKGERVLIHAGMSPIGQAAIGVALHIGANLYVTVTSHTQKAALLNLFPKINPLQVIVIEQNRFDLELKKLTKNTGVEVILNCLKKNELNASFRSLSSFARMIHLSDIKPEDNEELGMFPFAMFNHVFGVSLDNIVNAEPECKTSLKMLVENGVRNGVVKPSKHRTFSLQNQEDAFKNLKENNSVEKTVLVKSDEKFNGHTGFNCNPDDTFIVLGTKQGLWLDLSEYLLKSGARRLVIASLKQNLTTNVSRKFNNLMIQHRATIVMTTISRLDTLRGAEEFIQEAVRIGPVAGIYCTFMEEKSSQLTNLDTASRQILPDLKLFACLLGGGANVCESRVQAGFSACLVQSDSSLSHPLPSVFLPQLLTIISGNNKQSTTFLVSQPTSKLKHRGSATSLQQTIRYLPHTLAELEMLGCNYDKLDSFSLQELSTLSLKYQSSRYQQLPIFLLPGLDVTRLGPLSRHLMHPTFSPKVLPTLATVQQIADALLQQVTAVQRQGPYNLVAECWSSSVALQLASLLETAGHQVELFLLEATPTMEVDYVKTLCQPTNHFDTITFLYTLLALKPNVAKKLVQLDTWEAQLNVALNQTDVSGEQNEIEDTRYGRERIGKALTALKTRIQAILQFDVPETLFQGNVHLLRISSASDIDYCGLKKLCKQTPIIHITEDSTVDEMLKNSKTASIINEHVAFSWNL